MSHPNLDFLGWVEGEKNCSHKQESGLCIGGMSITDAPRAIEKGFQGIAGITTFGTLFLKPNSFYLEIAQHIFYVNF